MPALEAAACVLASPVANNPRIEVADAVPNLEDPAVEPVAAKGADTSL